MKEILLEGVLYTVKVTITTPYGRAGCGLYKQAEGGLYRRAKGDKKGLKYYKLMAVL